MHPINLLNNIKMRENQVRVNDLKKKPSLFFKNECRMTIMNYMKIESIGIQFIQAKQLF
jgi:hypothetical protein